MLGDLFKRGKQMMDAAQRTKEVNDWLDRIGDARKREKNYRKDAKNCLSIYDGGTKEGTANAYNILYANTETMGPALYNSLPRVVVRSRWKGEEADMDPVKLATARVLQRVTTFLISGDQTQYTPFDKIMGKVVTSSLVPGRGISRYKYEATYKKVQQATEVETEPASQEEPATQEEEVVDQETICGEIVPWDRLLIGYALTWETVPWIAFEHFYTKAELEKNFGARLAKEIRLTAARETGDEDDKANQPKDSAGEEFAQVYEIWDKATRTVRFVTEGYPKPLKVVDDPFKLEGFFPLPEPLILLQKLESMVPVPLYTMYEVQADELASISTRIIRITRALKVRGFYDGTIQDIDRLMQAEDNTLLKAGNVAAMQQGYTLDKAIWLMPIEKLVTVLQQLYLNRNAAKQTIFEICGIADIMRGSTAASETLGAQQIKQQWGSLRLKTAQGTVAGYAKNSICMIAELAAKHFGQDTLARMSGMRLPTQKEKDQAKIAMQQLQQQVQAQTAMAQQTGQQPPPPPPQAAQLQQLLALPAWEDIMAILRDDLLRHFTIDIETNSTIEQSVSEDKEEVSEFMSVLGQMLAGLSQAMEQGLMDYEGAKSFVLEVAQRFRFGQEVLEKLKDMKPPAQKQDPAVAKAQADQKREQQKFELEQQTAQQELEQKKALAELQTQIEQERLELQREKLRMEREHMTLKHKLDMEALTMRAAMPPAAPQQTNQQPGA